MSEKDATDLVERHLHTPYAYPALREALVESARQAIARYFALHGSEIANTIHSEKPIQVHLGDGVVVDGRVDLIRRLDTEELSVVDFKSTERAQPEEVTRDQLHVYALGYEELTGQPPDLIEVLNLDEKGSSTREDVEATLLVGVKDRVLNAGRALRENQLPRLTEWGDRCAKCDVAALCRSKP